MAAKNLVLFLVSIAFTLGYLLRAYTSAQDIVSAERMSDNG